jgi:hypothetical protein
MPSAIAKKTSNGNTFLQSQVPSKSNNMPSPTQMGHIHKQIALKT